MHAEVKRAARLVELIRNKVQLNPVHYHTFIGVLEEDSVTFEDSLRHLKVTYHSLTGGKETLRKLSSK